MLAMFEYSIDLPLIPTLNVDILTHIPLSMNVYFKINEPRDKYFTKLWKILRSNYDDLRS